LLGRKFGVAIDLTSVAGALGLASILALARIYRQRAKGKRRTQNYQADDAPHRFSPVQPAPIIDASR
jgi:hypothetical protein